LVEREASGRDNLLEILDLEAKRTAPSRTDSDLVALWVQRERDGRPIEGAPVG